MSTTEFAAIETLDLAPIKRKLMHVESGEGWSALRVDAVEAEYRRFLFLMKKYPDSGASPTVDVDIFWHYHILDTMKYAADCETVFGYFLHHYPYVGIGASANDGDHAAGGERMRDIYEAEFGAWPAAAWSARIDTGAWQLQQGIPREAANAATAFCSAPGKPVDAAHAVAFCSAPGKPGQAANAPFAFCSAPGKPREVASAAHALCSAPGKPGQAANAAFAFCSAPGKPGQAASAAHAFCSAPGNPRQVARAAHAFCSAPGKPGQAANAAHAFCSAPGKPGQAANAAYAFCSAPGKALAHAA